MSMMLYHGTNEEVARKALKQGLRPRSEHKRSNWKHTVGSNKNMVYLTDVYPLYFAANATKKDQRMAVIEIDRGRLSEDQLFPDEDVLEQANRRSDDLNPTWTLRQRVTYYRNNMQKYSGKTDASLNAMGTCAHLGPILPDAITRIALIDGAKLVPLVWAAMDASITTANYRFCKSQYHLMTQWVFGAPATTDGMSEADKFMIGRIVPILQSMKREDGIEIIE